MRRIVLLASALALGGCESMDYFSQPLAGESFCDSAWSGMWVPSSELARELVNSDGIRTNVTLTLEQQLDCENAVLLMEACDDLGEEGEECSRLSWSVGFVRFNERTFANLRLADVDDEPVSNRQFDVVEIRDVTESRAELSLVDGDRLTELIDAGRLTGTHREGPHGPVITVTASGEELAGVVASEPDLFQSEVLQLDKRD